MSFLYSGSLWSSLYCGVSSLCVGLYRWLVKVSWLGKLVSMFWWMELYFFSLLSKSWAAFLGAWCPLPVFRSCFVEFTRRLNALLMNLWGRKCSPRPTPPPSSPFLFNRNLEWLLAFWKKKQKQKQMSLNVLFQFAFCWGEIGREGEEWRWDGVGVISF